MAGVSPIHSNIAALILEADTNQDAAIVSIYQKIKELGLKVGLVEHRRIGIDKVRVHRHNRDGVMVSGREAMIILGDVNRIGVSMDLLKDATAFEEPRTRINENAFIAKTQLDKYLATYVAGQVHVSSVACSHFNQALMAVEQGIEYHDLSLTTSSGRLSKEKLCTKHPLFIPIFSEGLEWWVWKEEAEQLFPRLPVIVQKALNTKFSVQQGQDGFQLYICAVNGLNNPTIPVTSRVMFATTEIMKSNPKIPENVPFIVETARKFGGSDDQFVTHLIEFCGSHKQGGREVTTGCWKALSHLKFAASQLCPMFIVSVLMCIASAESSIAVQAGDIRMFGTKIEIITKAESIIKQALDLCNTMGVTDKDRIQHMGNLRTSLVIKIVDRSKELKKTSIECIASSFYCAVKEVATIDACNPWKDHSPIVSPVAPSRVIATTKATAVVAYNAAGKATNAHAMILKEKGVKDGTLVKHKESGDCRD
jgi:hypothetical protein